MKPANSKSLTHTCAYRTPTPVTRIVTRSFSTVAHPVSFCLAILFFISQFTAIQAEEALTPATGSNRPNVLFIAIDDLRADLGAYGTPIVQSPNIDRVAKSGMVFGNAFCQFAVCSPSRSSMFTGTRPDTMKVWNLSTHFRKALPDVVTLPQHFKNHGYFTQGLGKTYHSSLPDELSWSVPSTNPKAPHGAEVRPRGAAIQMTAGPDNAHFDGELADMALVALREVKERSEPFFLTVGFIKPHLPFNVPQKYFDRYDPADITLAPNPFHPKGAPPYAVNGGGELHGYGGVPKGRHLPDDYARQVKHAYYAAISFVDAQVGRIIEELENLGLSDNTIVVIWSDHGFKLGEHAAWSKHSNVEIDTRAPLVISIPGMAHAGETANGLVEFVDIYPTLSELAGLPLPDHLEGSSFEPLLNEPNRDWKTAVFSQFPRGKRLMGYSMRTERYRLTTWVSRSDHSRVDAIELYDHQTDPQENINIANDPANQELVAKLTAQWRAGWQAAIPQ